MRLDTTQRSLQIYLDRIDSLYDTHPDMRKVILKAEKQKRINFERLERARHLKAEAKALGKAAREK
jgi:hypothetical protein